VFGNRRLKATIRAGIKGIKAVVRLNVDEHTRFIYNLVENIQRTDLTPKEKADAIRELAESGYGVRELSRATGLQPSTISRLTRISRKPAVIAALEAGEIDVFKAMQLANLKDDTRLDELISLAPSLGATEFSTLITSIRPGDSYCLDDGRLADVDRKLAKVRVITPVGVAHLRRIVEQAVSLISQYEADQITLPGIEESAERGRRLSLSAESVVARQHPREGRATKV
jgi:lambda repressor-like predicted transcriptional regulator